MEHQASPLGGKVTVSAGVAAMLPGDGTKEELINNSDKALYLAKTSGRNCYKIKDYP